MSKVRTSKRKAAKVLRNGAKFLETVEWLKGDYYKDGAYCALGAIRKSNDIPLNELFSSQAYPNYTLACQAFEAAIGNSPEYFNDNEAFSKRSVIRAMRKTAAKLEHGLVVKSV